MLGTVNCPNAKILAQMIDRGVSGKKENLRNAQQADVLTGEDISTQNTIKSKTKPNPEKENTSETPQNDFKSHLEEKIKKLEPSVSEEAEGQEEINDEVLEEPICTTLEISESSEKSAPVIIEGNKNSLEKVEKISSNKKLIEVSNEDQDMKHPENSMQTPKVSMGQDKPSVPHDQGLSYPEDIENNANIAQAVTNEMRPVKKDGGQNKAIQLDKNIEMVVNTGEKSLNNSEIKDVTSAQVTLSKEITIQRQQANQANMDSSDQEKHSIRQDLATQPQPKSPQNSDSTLSESATESLHSRSLFSNKNKESSLSDSDVPVSKKDIGDASGQSQTKPEISGQEQILGGFEIRNVESVEHAAEPAERASISAVENPSRSGIHRDTLPQDIQPVDQILKHISTINVSQAPQRISLMLSPGYLGAVRVTFQHEGEDLIGVLQVQRPEIKKEIEETLPQLISSMQNNGLQIRRIEVVPWDSNQQTQRHSFSDGLDSSMEQDFSGQFSDSSSSRDMGEPDLFNRTNSEMFTDGSNQDGIHLELSDNIDKGLNMLV